MVKLFSVSVLHKTRDRTYELKSAHELSSVGFFQKGTASEFLNFISKTVVEKTDFSQRQSIKQDDYMCHVYVRNDGLAGVVVSDHEYPHRVAHTLLTKIVDEFAIQVEPQFWKAEPALITYSKLPEYLAKYQVPSQADPLTKIQNELDETKIIMHNTIEAVLDRGEKIDDLVAKSEGLSLQSKAFYKTARKTNSCCRLTS